MRPGTTSTAFQQAAEAYRRIEELLGSGAHDAALDACKELVRVQPRWPYGHFVHGLTLMAMARFEEARRALRKAVSLNDSVAVFHAKLGEVLHRLDDTDGAVREIERAMALEPNEPGHITTKAWVLQLSGRVDEAIGLLAALYDSGERDHRMVRIYARLLGQRGDAQRGIEILRPLAEQEHPEPMVIGSHWYVLAHLYDKLGQYDLAYDAATRGATLNAKTYDPEAHEQLMNERLGAWSASAMPTLARSRQRSERPIFIVGMPRSGTTLVEQIIGAHPQAHAGGELMNIFVAAQELAEPNPDGAGLSGQVAGLKQAALDRVARRILRDMDKLAPAGSKPERITDKLVLNFQHIGLIEQLFPNARVIACTRHPLDVFISSYLLDFEGHNAHAYTDRPAWFAHFYALHLQYIEHYTRVCSLPILEVRYEDIVADQRGQTERLLDFAGLPFDEACMRFFEHERAVVTASSDQVRKRLYSGSIGRHERYASHLGEVRDALRMHGVSID